MAEASRHGLHLLRRARSETSVEKEFSVRKIHHKSTIDGQKSDTQMSSSDPNLFPPSFFRELRRCASNPRIATILGEQTAWEAYDSNIGELPPISSRQFGTIAILALASFCSTVMISSIAPFFPLEAKKMGASGTEIALIFGVFELFVFLLTPACHRYLAFFGSKNMFVAGVLLEGGSTVCFGFLRNLPQGLPFVTGCFLARIFQAVGDSAFFTSSVAIIANEFPERIGTIVALVETFIGFGVTMGPPLGGALYQVLRVYVPISIEGFRLPFLVNGVSLVIIGVAGIFLVSWQEDMTTPTVGRIRDMLRIPAVLLMSVAVVSGVACINFLDPTLQPHLEKFDLPPFFVGLMFLAVSGVYTTAAPLWRCITDRYWLNWEVMMAGVSFTVLAMLFIGPSPAIPLEKSVLSIGLSEALLGIGVSAVYVPAFENALEILRKHNYPDSFGYGSITYEAYLFFFLNPALLRGFVGPTLGGVLADYVGFSWTSFIFCGVNLIVLILLCLYFLYNWSNKPSKAESQDLIAIMSDSALISDFVTSGKPHSGNDLYSFID